VAVGLGAVPRIPFLKMLGLPLDILGESQENLP
jgi:hypothetical protein